MKSAAVLSSVLLAGLPATVEGLHIHYAAELPNQPVIREFKSSLRSRDILASNPNPNPNPHPRALPSPNQSKAKRGSPDAPDGYTPSKVTCPSRPPSVRRAELSSNETKWLSARRTQTTSALLSLLGKVKIQDFDYEGWINEAQDTNSSSLPTLGIAMSGGGYRAMLSGAGVLDAYDDRTASGKDEGGLGGVLQSATYLSGLSGGGWLVGSMYMANFTSVTGILNGEAEEGLWQFDDTIIEGPQGTGRFEYYREINDAIDGKEVAGFNTTITDIWGRTLSYQLISPKDGGPAYTFSSIANEASFRTGDSPLPLLVAIERAPNQLNVTLNSTIFEFSPWELGSYDPGTAAYAPLKYIGSSFSNGSVSEDGDCIAGYDNAGFVMGTSSSLFNAAVLALEDEDEDDGPLGRYVTKKLEEFGEENQDVAQWPNPFFEYGVENARNLNADQDILALVDGGMALENLPLHPLLWRERKVDVIIAADASADTSNYPNATALLATARRINTENPTNASLPFPEIPDVNTIVNLGLNARPTFFGCPKKYTAYSDDKEPEDDTPLVIYVPNAPYSFHSNVSTVQMEFSEEERDDIIENGRNVATLGMGTVDERWGACLACGILLRSFQRRGDDIPAECGECLERYCWDGQFDRERSADDEYWPTLKLDESAGGKSFGLGRGNGMMWLGVVLWLVLFTL